MKRPTGFAGGALLLVAAATIPGLPFGEGEGSGDGAPRVRVEPGRVTTAEPGGHECGPSCRHGSPERVARPLRVPAGLRSLLGGTDDEPIRLGTDERSWTVEIHDRSARADGKVVVNGRTADGRVLFAVTDGAAWEGRLSWRDRNEAWLLRGDARGASAERCALSEIWCSFENEGLQAGGLPPIAAAGPVLAEAPPGEELALAESVPILHSLSGANGVIYLDFDGETVSGTNFNSFFTGGAPIVAGAAGFSNGQIQTIWEHVAEDFRPFHVNVTTDRAVFEAAPTNRRVMVIFTPDNEWYGGAGGVAFLNTFGSSFYDEPAWVFVDQLTYNGQPHPPYAAEAASHEVGHTLGLSHDGASGSEYYQGHGTGATTWAPIMGVGYSASVTQWSRGEYPGATNTQDDLAVISGSSNGLGYRPDDYADSSGAASPFPAITNGGLHVHASGVIERNTDVDVFEVACAGGEVSFVALNDPGDANLDLKLRLLDAGGGEVAGHDPSGSLDASLTATLAAGTYYLEVSGVGTGTTATGYSDYGSLGAFRVSGTLPEPSLDAAIVSPAVASLSLPAGTGLVLEGSLSAGDPEWQVISTPPGGSASFADSASLVTDCVFKAEGLYQLRFRATHEGETAAADLWVSVEGPGATPLHPNRGTGIDLGPDGSTYQDCVMLSPLLEDDGVPGTGLALAWSVLSGDATLSDPGAAQPELTFASPDPVAVRLVVDDGEIRTCGEVMLTGRFHEEILVAGGATARVHVPADGDLDAGWTDAGFDDSAWASGPLGVGFNANSSPPESLRYDGLIGAGMDLEAAMHGAASSCYLRVPFELPVADAVLQVVLHMRYDDGFVAYVNGVEVARANAPAGTPGWDSVAANDRSDEAGETAVEFPLAIPDGLLVDGTNVLAVHGLNSISDLADREFLLVPQLAALGSSLPFLESVAAIADPAQRGLFDDPDGDGRDNLQEHGAGTDPNIAEAPAILEVRDGEQPGNVEVRVRLPVNPPSDLRYEIEYRDDLSAAWTPVAVRAGGGLWSGAQPAAPAADGPNYEVFVFDHLEIGQGFWRLGMVRVEVAEAPVIAP